MVRGVPYGKYVKKKTQTPKTCSTCQYLNLEYQHDPTKCSMHQRYLEFGWLPKVDKDGKLCKQIII